MKRGIEAREKTRFKVIDDTGSRFNSIMRWTSAGMARAATGAGESRITMLEAVSGVVRPALRGALRASGDSILGTQAIVMGVLSGAGRKKAAALKVLSDVGRAVIRQTAGMNGDVGAAVTGLVRGALAGSERMGVTRAKAATTVVQVAVDEIHRIGSAE